MKQVLLLPGALLLLGASQASAQVASPCSIGNTAVCYEQEVQSSPRIFDIVCDLENSTYADRPELSMSSNMFGDTGFPYITFSGTLNPFAPSGSQVPFSCQWHSNEMDGSDASHGTIGSIYIYGNDEANVIDLRDFDDKLCTHEQTGTELSSSPPFTATPVYGCDSSGVVAQHLDVRGLDGADEIWLPSAAELTSQAYRVAGGRHGDSLYGSPGGDVMLGQFGSDYIHGYGGVDVVDGGPGTDDCYGGEFVYDCE